MEMMEPLPITIAGSEPEILRNLGTRTSNAPEHHGVDVMWASPLGIVGIQRKQFPDDFSSSMEDGRLALETGQAVSLPVRILLLEGAGTWSTDGKLLSRYGSSITRQSHRSFLLTLRLNGWWVAESADMADTIDFVRTIYSWSMKSSHNSTRHRPGPPRPLWGQRGSKDFQRWLLQGFPGVGPEMAERIIDKFGKVPLKWEVTRKELLEIDGVGPKTVDRLWDAL